jgi:O-antigen/teichoic acid export membrane protein
MSSPLFDRLPPGESEKPSAPRAPIRGATTLFSDWVAMLSSRAGSAVFAACSVVLMTRLFAPAQYGALAFFTVVALLLFTVASAWTSLATIRYGREAVEATGRMAAVNWSRLLITIPPYVLTLLLVLVLQAVGALPAEFSWSLVWFSILYGSALIIGDHCLYLLQAAGRMKLSAISAVMRHAVLVILLATLYVASDASILAAAAIFVVSAALPAFLFAGPIWRVAFWPPTHDGAVTRRLLAFSVPVIAFTVSQYVIRFVDVIVIRAFGDAADVGLYALAYQGYGMLQTVASSGMIVLIPLFVSLRAGGQEHLVRRFLERVVPMLTFVTATIAGILAPLAVLVVPVLFGDRFHGTAEPLAILMLPLVMFTCASLLMPVLVLHERSRDLGLINGAAALVNVGADVVLIGPLHTGISGAAIATSLALAVLVVGYVKVGRECTGAVLRANPLCLAPCLAGIAPAVLLRGTPAVLLGVWAAASSSLLMLLLLKPFGSGDAELIQMLRMPTFMKRLALRSLALASR